MSTELDDFFPDLELPGSPRTAASDSAAEAPKSKSPGAVRTVSQLATELAHEIGQSSDVIGMNAETLAGYLKVVLQLLSEHERLLVALTKQDRATLAEQARKIKRIRDTEELSFIVKDTPALLSESKKASVRLREVTARLTTLIELDPIAVDENDLPDIVAKLFRD